MDRMIFTSECVSMGHPDKVADQISDAVLDAYLAKDPNSRVACETLVTHGLVLIAGEITSKGVVDHAALARRVIRDIGYTDAAIGFDAVSCSVLQVVGKQSPDIAMGVDEKGSKDQGAGDQGIMFGYATDETPEKMPLPIMLARRIINRLADAREKGEIAWLRPDAKSQVTIEYVDARPVRVHTVVVSTQHKDVPIERVRREVIAKIVKPSIPAHLLDKKTIYLVNPTGRFVVGGPAGDTGLTGRKIIVDTYGGMGRHGGGAFSGKDPSKVDRSASYAARHIAKNVVAAGLAARCEIQLSYAIGVAKPLSIHVDCFGTETIQVERIVSLIERFWDLRPKAIIERFRLKRPIYERTARYGHFGIAGESYTWEKEDVAAKLKKAAR